MTSPADPHDPSVTQPVNQTIDSSIEKPVTASIPGNGLEYEKIYQSLADAIFIIKVEDGPLFRYIDSNRYHEQMTGLARDDLRGKTPQEALPPYLAITVEKNYRRCWNLKSTIVYEETLSLPKVSRT